MSGLRSACLGCLGRVGRKWLMKFVCRAGEVAKEIIE